MSLATFKYLSPKQKALFSLVGYVLISFGIYYFVIIGTMNNIKEIRGNIISEKINIEKNISQEKNMSELSAEVKKIEPQMKKFSQIFINNNRELEFITQLENIASKHNIKQKLSLQSLEIDEGNGDDYYFEVPIDLETSGTLGNLINYLAELESLTYYININNISIGSYAVSGSASRISNGSNATPSNKNIVLNLSATTYWK